MASYEKYEDGFDLSGPSVSLSLSALPLDPEDELMLGFLSCRDGS